MTYFPEKNLPAFLWTRAEYENQPSALTVADSLLEPTRLLTNYSFKILHLDGYFTLNTYLSREKFSTLIATACASMAAEYFKNRGLFLAYSTFTILSCVIRVIDFTIDNYFEKIDSIGWGGLFNLFYEALRAYIVILGAIAICRTGLLFFSKCCTLQFFMGVLLKFSAWGSNKEVQEMFTTYFKTLHSNIISDNGSKVSGEAVKKFCFKLTNDKATFGEKDSLVLDLRNKVLGYFKVLDYFISKDFITLRLISHEWSVAITKNDVLICRINERFSQVFINQIGQANLFNILCANPLDKQIILKSNPPAMGKKIYEELGPFLSNLLVDKSLVWGKLLNGEIFLCFKREVNQFASSFYIIKNSQDENDSKDKMYYFYRSSFKEEYTGFRIYKFDDNHYTLLDPERFQKKEKNKNETDIFKRITAANFNEIY